MGGAGPAGPSHLALLPPQGPRAEAMMLSSIERGKWVFFQNCHLAPSWMPALERLIEHINPDKVHQPPLSKGVLMCPPRTVRLKEVAPTKHSASPGHQQVLWSSHEECALRTLIFPVAPPTLLLLVVI